MSDIGIGVIGCGVIGKMHMKMCEQIEHARLVAVADLNEAAAEAAAKEFGGPTIYTDAAELIADAAVNAVVVALPTGVRLPSAKSVLQAGKHLLIEKPPAMNAGEIKALLALQGDRVGACCSSRQRCVPSGNVVKRAIAEGRIGAVRSIHCRCLKGDGGAPDKAPPPWRVSHEKNGGGFLVNWGVYDLDVLLGVFDFSLEPRWVMASTWPIAGNLPGRIAEASDAECHVVATLRFAGGATLHLERAEFAATQTELMWRIVGDQGTLRFSILPSSDKEVWLDRLDPEEGVVSECIWKGDESWEDCHGAPLRDFVAAIRGEGTPGTSLEEALKLQKIIDAIYEAAKNDSPVQFD